MLATLYIPIKQSAHLRGEARAACQVSALPCRLRKVSEADSGGGRSKSQNSSLKLLGKRKGHFLHTRASKPTKTHPCSWLSQKWITFPCARGKEFFRRPASPSLHMFKFLQILKGSAQRLWGLLQWPQALPRAVSSNSNGKPHLDHTTEARSHTWVAWAH